MSVGSKDRNPSERQIAMRVCIHRGTKQIGGTCVEMEASGSRIIVDLGLPLDAVEADSGTSSANFWPAGT